VKTPLLFGRPLVPWRVKQEGNYVRDVSVLLLLSISGGGGRHLDLVSDCATLTTYGLRRGKWPLVIWRRTERDGVVIRIRPGCGVAICSKAGMCVVIGQGWDVGVGSLSSDMTFGTMGSFDSVLFLYFLGRTYVLVPYVWCVCICILF
jgi:hypothetical protein